MASVGHHRGPACPRQGTPPEEEWTAYGYPAAAADQGRRLYPEAASGRAEALSAGADAGAAVPLQPGLRRLRQDRLSRRDPEQAPVGRGMPGRGRRMRRARGRDRRRRAAAAQGDAGDRREASWRAARSSSSAPMPCCWRRGSSSTSRIRASPGPSTWTATRSSTTRRSARQGVYDRAVAALKLAKAQGLPRQPSTATLFNNAEPERDGGLLRRA